MHTAWLTRWPTTGLWCIAVLYGAVLTTPVTLGGAPSAYLQLGAMSATLAGLTAAALVGGRPAVRALLRRGLVWRVGWRWWAIAVFLPLVPAFAAHAAAARYVGHAVSWTALTSILSVVPTLAFLTLAAGLGEEFGWRGFATSRLLPRHRRTVVALIVGGWHALWHLPLFFVADQPYAQLAQAIGLGPAFVGYGILVLALAVQLTWIYTRTGESVLLAAVYHGAANSWAGHLAIDVGGLPVQLAYLIAHAGLALLLVASEWVVASRDATAARAR